MARIPFKMLKVDSNDFEDDGSGSIRLKTVQQSKIPSSIPTSKLADGASFLKADGTVPMTGSFDAGNQKVTNVGTPSAAGDAATKGYVDGVAQGLRIKDSVLVATAAALDAYVHDAGVLTASANGVLTVDGVAPPAGSRVLVKDEPSTEFNGWYDVTDAGSVGTPWVLTRSADANVAAELAEGSFCWVKQGTANGNTRWAVSTEPTTLGTDPIVFTQIGAAAELTGGNGISIDGSGNVAVNLDGTAPGLTFLSGKLAVLGGTGVEVAAGGLRLAVSGAGDGLEGGGGVGYSVKAENDSVAVGASGVKAAVPVTGNKSQNPTGATSGDGSTTGVTIAATPAADSYVRVLVNGIGASLGDGIKTKECYFSADGGTTARAISAIQAGDTLFWNGTVAGYELATTDEVDFDYCTTAP